MDSSSAIAKRFRVPHIVIGLTIVAFGTSLPELIVNLFAVFNDAPQVVFGNIIGSNIANVLLVLGITAMVGTVRIKAATIWKEIPFAILASFILFILANKIIFGIPDRTLGAFDGLILLALFATFLYYILQTAKRERKEVTLAEKLDTQQWKMYGKLVLGLIGIYFAGKWTVGGAILLAEQFGLSQFLISATLIALGTSLPELVVCIIAVLKKNIDLAVGNVIGSNIFNILWVLGIIPLIKPLPIPTFIGFDLLVMLFSTIFLFIFMFIGAKHELRRNDGIALFTMYIIYIVLLLSRG